MGLLIEIFLKYNSNSFKINKLSKHLWNLYYKRKTLILYYILYITIFIREKNIFLEVLKCIKKI